MKILYIRKKTPQGMRHNYHIVASRGEYIIENSPDPPEKTIPLVQSSINYMAKTS